MKPNTTKKDTKKDTKNPRTPVTNNTNKSDIKTA